MMRIDPFTIDLDPPLGTAGGTIATRDGFLIRVEFEGVTGFGEATPLPGWTESLEACREALDRAAGVAEELDWGIALRRMEAPAARHGLSLALADARSQTAGLPLYRVLGGNRPVDQVPVNGTIGDGSPKHCQQAARRIAESGLPAVKLKVGAGDLERDRKRVTAVRKVIGDLELRLDANGAWDRNAADAAIRMAVEHDVSYVEQPLPAPDLTGMAELRGQGVGIAVDETLVEYDLAAIRDAKAADIIICKPMVVGGPDRASTMARTARDGGLEVVVSTTVDAAVARAGAVHVAATIPDVWPCGLATGDRVEQDLCSDPTPIESGAATVPQDPGIGLPEEPRP